MILLTSDRATLLTYVALLILTAAAWVAMLRSPMGGDDMAGMQMGIGFEISRGRFKMIRAFFR